jgi:hypothetical protein
MRNWTKRNELWRLLLVSHGVAKGYPVLHEKAQFFIHVFEIKGGSRTKVTNFCGVELSVFQMKLKREGCVLAALENGRSRSGHIEAKPTSAENFSRNCRTPILSKFVSSERQRLAGARDRVGELGAAIEKERLESHEALEREHAACSEADSHNAECDSGTRDRRYRPKSSS